MDTTERMRSSPALADFDGNRQNNFTIVRITLAWLVLYGHSFHIQRAAGVVDPLGQIFQTSTWIGELAVNGFFAISGFLVAASLVRRGFVDYTISRVLRIYPALFVCVFSMVFILGPLMTSLPMDTYFAHERTTGYLTNALAFIQMRFDLPGVFADNPSKAVNGSLWSLTAEVRCYLLLGIAGLLHLLKYRTIANLMVLAVLALNLLHYPTMPLLSENPRWARPALFFLIGVFFYLNRDRVYLDGRIAVFAAALMLYSFGSPWSQYVFPVSLAYLLFYLAYRTPFVNLDGKLGDISYGVYIYAWPVQQLVRYWFPHEGPYSNTLMATPIVIGLAWLSWHFIEKPVLARKQWVMGGIGRAGSKVGGILNPNRASGTGRN